MGPVKSGRRSGRSPAVAERRFEGACHTCEPMPCPWAHGQDSGVVRRQYIRFEEQDVVLIWLQSLVLVFVVIVAGHGESPVASILLSSVTRVALHHTRAAPIPPDVHGEKRRSDVHGEKQQSEGVWWIGEAAYEVLGHRVASYLWTRSTGLEPDSEPALKNIAFPCNTLRFSGCPSTTHEEFVFVTTQETTWSRTVQRMKTHFALDQSALRRTKPRKR
jgi:hypothetical protein